MKLSVQTWRKHLNKPADTADLVRKDVRLFIVLIRSTRMAKGSRKTKNTFLRSFVLVEWLSASRGRRATRSSGLRSVPRWSSNFHFFFRALDNIFTAHVSEDFSVSIWISNGNAIARHPVRKPPPVHNTLLQSRVRFSLVASDTCRSGAEG